MEAGGSRTDGEAFQKERRSRGREGSRDHCTHLREGHTCAWTLRGQSAEQKKNQTKPRNQEIHNIIGNYAPISQELTYHSGKNEQTK